LFRETRAFFNFGNECLIIKAKAKGIKNTVATGIKTSITEMLDELLSIAGSRKGSKKAMLKFVTNIEITENSIFPFNKFTIIGDAIAVGAMPVIKTTSANVKLNSFRIK
jgi:uncharacterized protein YhdP